MKVLLAVLLLTGCGAYRDRIKPKDGAPGTSCTTRHDSVGVFVECTDGTDSFIPFPKDGETVVGPAGEAGSSCSVNDSGLITCTDGSSHQINDGQNGTNGISCLLVERNVTCNNHKRKFKQFLVCPNAEVYIKDVSVSNGC